MLKLRFEPDLDFQLQAVDAVCDLFRGQEVCRTEFTVTRDRLGPQRRLAFAQEDLGVGNRLTLLDDEILANLKEIQLRNGLPPSEASRTIGADAERRSIERQARECRLTLRVTFAPRRSSVASRDRRTGGSRASRSGAAYRLRTECRPEGGR